MATKKKPKTDRASAGATPTSSDEEKFTYFFGPASPFSQWHPASFTLDEIEFCCAEQYMMYQKAVLFGDKKISEEIMATSIPKEHKALGRKVSNFDVEQWKRNSQDIVRRGNMAKFSQNSALREQLLATAGTTLVEASPFDTVWGIGLSAKSWKAKNRKNWRGKNLLGEILTAVREDLMSQSTQK